MFERSESLAPDARVVVRDEEWLIRRVGPSAGGRHLLTCNEVSELVPASVERLSTASERNIEVSVPANTILKVDYSPSGNAVFVPSKGQILSGVVNDDYNYLAAGNHSQS